MNTIDTMSVNAIRVLSADAIQKAKSGHPGLPLGSAPAAYELWMNHMNHNPADPQWANRDRFILSGGHGSMLLYSLLHLFGYGRGFVSGANFSVRRVCWLRRGRCVPPEMLLMSFLQNGFQPLHSGCCGGLV